MEFSDRIGIDDGGRLSVEAAIAWSAANRVTYLDCQIDSAPNALESFDEARCGPIRDPKLGGVAPGCSHYTF